MSDHKFIADHQADCSDCPGPTRFPDDSKITKREILASIVRQVRPVFEEGSDGFPPALAEREFLSKEAAVQILTESEEAMEKVSDAIDRKERTLVFRREQDQKSRAQTLRNRVVDLLDQDQAFLETIRPAVQELQEMGILCPDCR